MLIAKIENDAIAEIGDHRDLFPNVSFPDGGIDADFMLANHCFTVSVWRPHSATEKLVACDPYYEGGQVFTVRVEAKTADELAAEFEAEATKARARRNHLLRESDWTQVADAPVDQATWAAYRQALRDITAQPGFPNEINWPEAPAT